MKKFIFAFFIALLFAASSCMKEPMPNVSDKSVTVEFLFNVSETGSVRTKSFCDEVLPELEYRVPTTLYLYGTGGKYKFDLSTSNKVSVQPGKYTVFSGGIGRSMSDRSCCSEAYDYVPLIVKSNGAIHACDTPRIAYTGYDIIIDENTTQITVDLIIPAIIIACKKEDASYFKWTDLCRKTQDAMHWTDSHLQTKGNYYFYILRLGDGILCDGHGQTIFAEIGETENYESTTCRINVTKESFAKYYVFSPNEKNFNTIDMNITSSWSEGQ